MLILKEFDCLLSFGVETSNIANQMSWDTWEKEKTSSVKKLEKREKHRSLKKKKSCSYVLGYEREFLSLPWENLSGQVIKRKVQATRRIKLPGLPRCLSSCSLWISKQVVWPGWSAARVTVTFSVLSRHCPIHVRTANLILKVSPGRRPWERLAPSTGPQSINNSAGKPPRSMCSGYQTYKANPTLSPGVAQKPKLGGANLALASLPENRLLCACPCTQHTLPPNFRNQRLP